MGLSELFSLKIISHTISLLSAFSRILTSNTVALGSNLLIVSKIDLFMTCTVTGLKFSNKRP
jgi:hypothetical protein